MLKRPMRDRPESGFTMNRWAVEGSAPRSGMRSGRRLELPQRAREAVGIADELRPGGVGGVLAGAAHGHLDQEGRERGQDQLRSAAQRVATLASSSRPPPIGMKYAIRASIEMAPARVAATVEMRVSRFRTWDSSWARTPSQLLAGHGSQDALRGRHRGVGGVAAGREGVRGAGRG